MPTMGRKRRTTIHAILFTGLRFSDIITKIVPILRTDYYIPTDRCFELYSDKAWNRLFWIFFEKLN